MRTTDALAYFKGNQSAVARALHLTRASVNAWGPLVPPLRAAQLMAFTSGALRFDPANYAKWNTKRKHGNKVNGRRSAPIRESRKGA